MKYKVVAFDLDDTLNDGTIGWKLSYEWLFREWHEMYKTTRETFDSVFEKKREELKRKSPNQYTMAIRSLHLSEMLKELDIKIDWNWIKKISGNYWKIFLDNISPRDGVINVIAEIQQKGYRLIIATDFSFDIQISKLNALGVIDYFSYIYTAEEVGSLKSTGDMFKYILKNENISAKEILMVGDNMKGDILVPNSFGIDTVLIKNKWYKYESSDETISKFYINKLEELLTIL